MPTISVRIPQLGEGLQEALLVELLKSPGDKISRDEPIYVMETDKATTDVESPYDGTLVEWLAEPDSVLAIGTEIARMEVAEGTPEIKIGHGPRRAETDIQSEASDIDVHAASDSEKTKPRSPRNSVRIPPRTRKYLRDRDLLDQVDAIPCSGSKLATEDVDAWLEVSDGVDAGMADADDHPYDTRPLPKSQIVLNYRLVRGVQACVPVTAMSEFDWSAIAAARDLGRGKSGPSGFAMACWCVARAMQDHEKFRSRLSGDSKSLHIFRHVNLGIAVARPGDEMVTAVIQAADELTADQFFEKFIRQIELAREGQDQADAATTLTVSNIGIAGLRMGIPAIVAPAVATLALGEVYQQPVPDGDSFKFQPSLLATLCFDHRVANGLGAAEFMSRLKHHVENFKI